MYFLGLGTATPRRRYSQIECWMALQSSKQFGELAPRSRAILKKVLTGKNGVATRYLTLEPLEEAFQISPDILNARFARMWLGKAAGRRCPICALPKGCCGLVNAGTSCPFAWKCAAPRFIWTTI